MSDSCRCPYSGLSIDELSLLKQEDLKKTLNTVIPVLFKYGEKDKIIRMTALLSSFEGVSEDTLVAVRTMAVPMIREGLYFCGPTTVEAMDKVVSNLEEGKFYWTQELVNYLEKQPDLKNIRTWLDHKESLEKIAETFQIRGTVESLLEKAIKTDEGMNKIGFWFENYTEIAGLVKAFASIEEIIREKVENTIETNGLQQSINFWHKWQGSLPFFLNELKISGEKTYRVIHSAKMDIILRVKNTFTDESLVKVVIENITQSGQCYAFMQHCLELEKIAGESIAPEEYQDIADNLLILANTLKEEELRKKIIRIAYFTYLGLKENYRIFSRNAVIKAYNDKNSNKPWDRVVLKEAAKIIPGLKYRKQSIWDF